MSPYIAIAKRDWRQNPWVYLYIFILAFIISPAYLISGQSTSSNTIDIFPIVLTFPNGMWTIGSAMPLLVLIGIQMMALRAMYGYSQAFIMPKIRELQYIYSIRFYLLVSLIIACIWHRQPTTILLWFGLFNLFSSACLLTSFQPNKTISGAAQSMAVLALISLIITSLGREVAFLIEQFADLYPLLQWLILLVIFGVASTFYLLSYRFYLKPQELNEAEMHPYLYNRNFNISAREQSVTNRSPAKKKALYDSLARYIRWQEKLKLIRQTDPIERAIFSSDLSAFFMPGLSLILSIVSAALILTNGVHPAEEPLSVAFFAFFYTMSWFFTSFVLAFELMRQKPLLGKLPLLYKGSRHEFMQHIVKVQIKRFLRFYTGTTLLFGILVALLSPSVENFQWLAVISLYNLAFIPITTGYVLTTLATHKISYSAGFRLSTIFIILFIFIAFILLVLLSPLHLLWMFLLGGLSLTLGYKRWCRYDLEAIG